MAFTSCYTLMSLLSTKVAILELLPTRPLFWYFTHLWDYYSLITSTIKVREKCMYFNKVRSSKNVGINCAIKVCKKADKYSDSSGQYVPMALETKKFWTEDVTTITILNLVSN